MTWSWSLAPGAAAAGAAPGRDIPTLAWPPASWACAPSATVSPATSPATMTVFRIGFLQLLSVGCGPNPQAAATMLGPNAPPDTESRSTLGQRSASSLEAGRDSMSSGGKPPDPSGRRKRADLLLVERGLVDS